MRQKLYIIFFLLVIIGTAAAYAASSGFYPVAVVQGRLIGAGQFRSEYRAASSYYEKAKLMYGKAFTADQELSPQDTELSVMDQIIEDAIVRAGAEQELGAGLSRLLAEKINKYENDPDLAKAATAIYNLNRKSFSDYVLVPQAMRDILTGQLAAKGQKFDDWLAAAKKSARVTIFSLRFKWDGEKVGRK